MNNWTYWTILIDGCKITDNVVKNLVQFLHMIDTQ